MYLIISSTCSVQEEEKKSWFCCVRPDELLIRESGTSVFFDYFSAMMLY